MQHRIRAIRRWLRPHYRTLQLAASYLLIIMIMSISFSVVLYHTSANEIGRQLPPHSLYDPDADYDRFDEFFNNRISRGQHDLLTEFIALNVGVLVAGAFVSYVLARRTLEPIEEAIEAQSRFAADASHELRTPLAAIQAENEVALRNPKLTLGRAKALLASNLEEVTRLQALAEALLKLAREDEPATLPLKPVNMSEVVSNAVNHCLKAAQVKHLTIDDQVPNLTALSDHRAVQQIVNVLLDNAVKYSPNHSTIAVTGQADGHHIVVAVADQGSGIGEDDLPHIFERFYRADQSRTSQQVGGYGLGLALADKLADQLGATIGVDSTVGTGSTFTLTLPAGPANN